MNRDELWNNDWFWLSKMKGKCFCATKAVKIRRLAEWSIPTQEVCGSYPIQHRTSLNILTPTLLNLKYQKLPGESLHKFMTSSFKAF